MQYEHILEAAKAEELAPFSDEIKRKIKWVKGIYEDIQKKMKANNVKRHLSKVNLGEVTGEAVKEFLIIIATQKLYNYKTIRDSIIPALKKMFFQQNPAATEVESRLFHLEVKKGTVYCKGKLEKVSHTKKKFQFFEEIITEVVDHYPPGKKNYFQNMAIMTLGFESGVRACAIAELELKDITDILPTHESKAYGDILMQINFRKEKGYYTEKLKNFFGYLEEGKKGADPVFFILEHLYETFCFRRMTYHNGMIKNNIVDKIAKLSEKDKSMKIFDLDPKEYSKMVKKAVTIAGYDCKSVNFHALRHSVSINGTIKELKGELAPGTTKHYVGHNHRSNVHERVYLGRLDKCLNGSAITTEAKEGQNAGMTPMVPELMDARTFNGIRTPIVAVDPKKIKRETLSIFYEAIRPYTLKGKRRRTELYHRIALTLEDKKWANSKLHNGALTDFICMKVSKMSRQEQREWIDNVIIPIVENYYL